MKSIKLVSELKSKEGKLEFIYRFIPEKGLNKLTQEKIMEKIGLKYPIVNLHKNHLEDYFFDSLILNNFKGGIGLAKPVDKKGFKEPVVTKKDIALTIIPSILAYDHRTITFIDKDKVINIRKNMVLITDKKDFFNKGYFNINDLDLSVLSEDNVECIGVTKYLKSLICDDDFAESADDEVILIPTVMKELSV